MTITTLQKNITLLKTDDSHIVLYPDKTIGIFLEEDVKILDEFESNTLAEKLKDWLLQDE